MAEKRLTKEIAEQLLADDEFMDLSEFTELDDEAAEVLSKYDEVSLELNGLTSLLDAAAESLSNKHRGTLYLSGLTELSDAAAESLSKCKGNLWLDLDALPESAAEILRQHPNFQDE